MKTTNDIISNNLQYYMNLNSINNKELSEIVGVSESTVGKWILKKATPRMGVIEKLANYFGIQKSDLLEDKNSDDIDLSKIPGIILPVKMKKIPILGTIACGEPIFAEENYEGYFMLDTNLPEADFILKAKGDSMIDADIYEGDLVFFRRKSVVDNGTIAAVIIEDEATLKKVYKNEHNIVLQPCNSNYAPIVLSENDHKNIMVLGEMVGVYSKRNK
ncbi:transcriptional repressor LexA [Peptoniphilus sp.]|uniref:transcriptional repressor LexA n=1 Tax=Peptoniphilus sp. TaxID=1971214 RepID=UPI003996218B